MARETKVGLIVGLGVILFVGIFVSDYLSVPKHQEAFAADELSDFHSQTNNQPQLLISRDEQAQPPATPQNLAERALQQAELRYGPPIEHVPGVDEQLADPPFRRMVGQVDDTTPVARRLYTPGQTPVGAVGIDDLSHATPGQLPIVPVGPAAGDLDPIVRVDIPDTPRINPQPRLVYHTVRSGETLTAIARQHYDGDGNMWRSIRDANPGKVGGNGQVVEGAELVIPKRSASADDPASELSAHANGESVRPAKMRVRLVKVEEGQTLSEIAYEHLGSGNRWPEIMAVNDDLLQKPEQLRAGMKLRIPVDPIVLVAEEANRALTENSEQPRETPEPAADPRTYKVKEGDSLYRIAAKVLGDAERYPELFKANKGKIKSADDIRVGMVIVVPQR